MVREAQFGSAIRSPSTAMAGLDGQRHPYEKWVTNDDKLELVTDAQVDAIVAVATVWQALELVVRL